MGFMREFPQYLKNRLEFEQFTPLIKSQVNVVGSPTTPAALGVTSARNTAVKCEYDKRAFIACYDRLAIASVFTTSMALKPVSITVTNVKRLRDLQPDLYRCLGIFPDPLEIADAAVTLNGNTVAVPVAADNPWFTGTLTVSLDTAYYSAADGTVIADLGTWDPRPFIHPTADPTTRLVMNGGMLTYGNDYTSQSGVLAAIPVRAGRTWANIASADADKLATALATVDGIPWVCNTAGTATTLYDWNLFASSVIYNGPTEAFDPLFDAGFTNAIQQYFLNYDLVDTRYTHVLIVHPNPSYGNKNLRYAPLFIHYGRKRSDAEMGIVYRQPKHDWSLLDTVDRGYSPLAWPSPLATVVDTDMGNWGKYVAADGILLPELLPATIDHTVSFEFMRSANAITGCGILAVGNVAADAAIVNAPGSIYIDSSNNIAIYGTTALWSRDAQSNAVNASNIVEVHFVRRKGLIYLYHNQQLVGIYNAPITMANNYVVFGKSGNTVMSNTEYVRNLRYWDIPLSATQIATINGADANGLTQETNPQPNVIPTRAYPVPLYEWLFNGNANGSGLLDTPLEGPWTFGTDANGNTGGYWNGAANQKFNPELRFRVCGDYTLDITVVWPSAAVAAGYASMMESVAGVLNTGDFYWYYGKFYEYLVTPSGNGSPWMAKYPTPVYGQKHRVTVRSLNGTTSLYVNGVLIVTYASPALSLARYITAWGGAADGKLPNTVMWNKFRYWGFGLTDAQLAEVWAD